MQAIHNTTANTITLKPAAPVDAPTFARLKNAGFAWRADSGAFVASPAGELARGVAADIAGQIETRDAAAQPVRLAPYLAEAIDAQATRDALQASSEAAAGQASSEAETDDDGAPAELCDDIERATYSPEDNKIRLYPARRLDPAIYARVKAAGFSWAPKQGVFVAPMWTPARADLAESLAGELGDEDTTLAERAEQRADRFEDYQGKRAADADQARRAVDAIAEHIPFGQPILVGHHSERRARKDAQRIEDGMRRAVKLWETAEYWTQRAAGAIQHAKYKERPDVRARRIKTIEAAERKQRRTLADAEKFAALWAADGLTMARALGIANYDWVSRCFPLADYPRAAPASQYEGAMSIYSALDGGIITPEQARDIASAAHARTIAHARRWIDHYQNRIAYERAMLAENGGLESDRVKPEKGGAIRCLWGPRDGWAWIVKVNKITVSILHTYSSGGRTFQHNVPLDKIREIMSAADVETARAAGRLVETDDKTGFYLAAPTPSDDAPEAETVQASSEAETLAPAETVQASGEVEAAPQNIAAIPEPTPAPAADPGATFAAMRESLRAGVQVVSAPQLFPTPAGLAARMVELADIQPGARVLEPSAGTGRILQAIREAWTVGQPGRPIRTAVEIDARLCDQLEVSEAGADIRRGDFLTMQAATLGTFDRVLMNPPFVNGADIKHIQHAAAMLAPGGRLVAICANGPRQRAQLMPIADYWEDLPAGTFAESGTDVRAALLVIEAPAASYHAADAEPGDWLALHYDAGSVPTAPQRFRRFEHARAYLRAIATDAAPELIDVIDATPAGQEFQRRGSDGRVYALTPGATEDDDKDDDSATPATVQASSEQKPSSPSGEAAADTEGTADAETATAAGKPADGETTAVLRARAHELAQALQWTEAADHYERAAASYPSRFVFPGSLGAFDVEKLKARASACRAQEAIEAASQVQASGEDPQAAPSGEQKSEQASGEAAAPLVAGRWIPHGAENAERIAVDAAIGAEVWLIASTRQPGLCAVIAYAGKRTKHAGHYTMRDRAQALQWAAEYLGKQQASAQRQAEQRAEKAAKRAAGHKLQVGDVLRSSWGYDQTNIDYYEVTRLVGKRMVEIRKIGAESAGDGYMTGDCVPRPGHYTGEPMRKMVSDYDGKSVRIASYASANKIEPRDVGGVKVWPVDHWTAYA